MRFLCVVILLCFVQVRSESVSTTLTNNYTYPLAFKDDARERSNTMLLSKFGFLKDAYFQMNLSLTFEKQPAFTPLKIGLRFDKSSSGGRSDYFAMKKCPLGVVKLDEKERMSLLSGSEDDVSRSILVFSSHSLLDAYHFRFDGLRYFPNSSMYTPLIEPTINVNNSLPSDRDKFINVTSLPYELNVNEKDWNLSTTLYFRIETEEQSGLYELYLHNCDGLLITKGTIEILQKNLNSFLSAGEICLPTMYTAMAAIVFLTTLFWIYVLWRNRSQVFKIHYLMALFMIIKVLSVTFHAIDYYFIGRDGRQEAWAVIFYVLHLLKGTLLFICLLLIGTGWAFIKYVLSDREKKMFMVVIPIQVVANIAYMIQEESSFTGTAYTALTWTELMFLFDILCFGVILVSVSWSIRHLQEASATDGKAAISVVKLKLFQHFYVMVIVYLYFRRVLVYLLQITLPFHYTWVHHFFYELASLVFFIITGYKFRPGCDNPYLSVPTQVDDEIESQPLTTSGLTETLKQVNQQSRDDSDDDETVVLLQRNKTTFI